MNRREFGWVLLALPLVRLVKKLPRAARPTVADAIKEIVDREGWSKGTVAYCDSGYLGFHEYGWTQSNINNDYGYFKAQATKMGQAARQTLERYVLGVMGNDGLIHIGEGL